MTQKSRSNLFAMIEQSPEVAFLGGVVLITVSRILLLTISDFNLGADEAQYWFWSLKLDFGYFSKPPLIAWIIGLTSNLFGEEEWAIRLASPLFHAGTAIFLYTTARFIHSPQAGFWTGTGWLLVPGVTLSSSLITTDVPLLFFWSGAILFLVRIIYDDHETNKINFIDTLCLGICIGLGMLSKYAMIYFPLATLLGVIASRLLRTQAIIQALLVSFAIALIIMAPNIAWNVHHDFQTLSHTAANANWQGSLFNPGEFGEFFIAQFGIIGPILFGVFLIGLILWRRKNIADSGAYQSTERILIILALLPLLIVSIQSLIARAHANWAATAYPAILLLAVIWLMRARKMKLLALNHGLGGGLALLFAMAASNFAIIDLAGFSNAVKRVRMWEVQGVEIAQLAKNYPTVMSDDRELSGHILYYGKQARRSFIAWDSNNHIDHHYEAFLPYRHDVPDPILYITPNPDAAGVHHMFSNVRKLGQSSVDVKRGRVRTIYFFELSDFRDN